MIVELKAVSEINADHRGQLFNYLRMTDSYAGILVNFGNPKRLISERYIYDYITGNYEYIDEYKFIKYSENSTTEIIEVEFKKESREVEQQ